MNILKDQATHHIIDNVTIIGSLPKGVYNLKQDMYGRFFLEQTKDITMPEKIYSNDKDFIAHVKRSFDNMNRGNLGVALVGEKGLGKSFTAMLIAKQTGIPVIKISNNPKNSELFSFLNKIEQDFVLLIDEFEKIFDENSKDDSSSISQSEFLSFLDGGSIRHNKILFLFTANNEYKISGYMKSRPSRVRYYREYSQLADNITKEIIHDRLEKDEFKEDLIEHLPYEELNIDVLIKIIDEINLHNVPYSTFKSFFNYKVDRKIYYNLFIKWKGKKILINKARLGDIDEYDNIGLFRDKDDGDKLYRVIADENVYIESGEPVTFMAHLSDNEQSVECFLEPEKFDKIDRSLVY